MKNILLPTDFSENSWNALEYALHLFGDSPCNFNILHANTIGDIIGSESSYIPTQSEIDKAFLGPSKKKMKQILRRISYLELKTRHRFFTLIDYNFFIESIKQHVIEKKIDIIIMGTKGATGLRKLIIGSNTADLITKVECTTMIVPEKAKFVKLKEMAFISDFLSIYSSNILGPISEFLDSHGASLRVLHIYKTDHELNPNQQKNKKYLADFFINYLQSFHFIINNDMESAIQSFAKSMRIDLIAMVAMNLNYFQRLFFHTTVQEISYHTEIPFLVLHDKKPNIKENKYFFMG